MSRFKDTSNKVLLGLLVHHVADHSEHPDTEMANDREQIVEEILNRMTHTVNLENLWTVFCEVADMPTVINKDHLRKALKACDSDIKLT